MFKVSMNIFNNGGPFWLLTPRGQKWPPSPSGPFRPRAPKGQKDHKLLMGQKEPLSLFTLSCSWETKTSLPLYYHLSHTSETQPRKLLQTFFWIVAQHSLLYHPTHHSLSLSLVTSHPPSSLSLSSLCDMNGITSEERSYLLCDPSRGHRHRHICANINLDHPHSWGTRRLS